MKKIFFKVHKILENLTIKSSNINQSNKAYSAYLYESQSDVIVGYIFSLHRKWDQHTSDYVPGCSFKIIHFPFSFHSFWNLSDRNWNFLNKLVQSTVSQRNVQDDPVAVGRLC